MPVIPIISVHSAPTWQVIVCLCACMPARRSFGEKKVKTHNMCAERCVRS